jgi:light-regulated signal transduction histidine kinase (bacteriophytochrome)
VGVAFEDVTARKQAEEALTALNTQLEEHVQQRTAQLEIANKELEAFAYSVSHDLRAPLRALDGFARALLEDYGPRLPADGQRYLDRIQEGVRQMNTLINDLLTFSRFSRQALKKHPISTEEWHALLTSIVADLRAATPARAVQVTWAALPPCEADPALLKQVLINLLANAFKYTRPRGNARIEVGCDLRANSPVYFVRDNGVGFDMQYAHKLFGVFQRLHRADEFEGTGVGLAIVQRIVERHGGKIWAEAETGHGATFYFTLDHV